MIPASTERRQTSANWQREQAAGYRRPLDLLADVSARLQIHTRQPAVLPPRVDAGFIAWPGSLAWKTTVVLHCNHPNEIDAELAAACARLRAGGGVPPYYLHQLDPARRPKTELARTLPGYPVPRLVREIPNRAAKTVISAGLGPA
jgi:L-lysine 2,3-aminomutase